ncbi:MAG: VOC family protein [Bacteroidales bacterium]|nr:VOC family protein [Bacteroidales bacterium]MCF8455552.1 VOC family protein [Bacteroidales bacterium]
MKNVVNWFEIFVDDMDRAKNFYSKVFQKEMIDLPTMGDEVMCAFAWVEGGEGSSGSLVKHLKGKGKPGVGGTTVYFTCEDCAVEQARVETNGGKVLMPKTSIGEYGFISLFKDSEGNMVGLHSRK